MWVNKKDAFSRMLHWQTMSIWTEYLQEIVRLIFLLVVFVVSGKLC